MNISPSGTSLRLIVCCFAALTAALPAANASPVKITILHTNDLHSHFRPEKTPLGLGGIARIATAVQRARGENPNTVLVDGGDWSEGNIYYRDGMGRDSLELMDAIGYDVTVVGNHDWLNGPDTLLDALAAAPLKMQVLGANFEATHYVRTEELAQRVKPYVIREVAGVRIAWIGLATYQFVFNKFLEPVGIKEPFLIARRISEKLKQEGLADVVVAISHNATSMNKEILKLAPELDFIIGAHDHRKFIKPQVVHRGKHADGWIVEAGCWGRYLGRIEIEAEPGQPGFTLKGYRLLQMDFKTPEDPAVLAKLDEYERRLEDRYGPIFHDELADLRVELSRKAGVENQLGDVITDAYRSATGAEIALDDTAFNYSELHRGKVSTADVYNSNPPIYNPKTGKSWTLVTLPLRGKQIRRIFEFAASDLIAEEEIGINVSGLSLVFDPLVASEEDHSSPFQLWNFFARLFGIRPKNRVVVDISANGEPLDPDRTYQVAMSSGLYAGIKQGRRLISPLHALPQANDTGLEDWRVLADYLRGQSPLTPDKIGFGQRIHTRSADVGAAYDDLTWSNVKKQENGVLASVSARITNTGWTSSPQGLKVRLVSNASGVDLGVKPDWSDLASAQTLGQLGTGQSTVLTWDPVLIPEDHGIYPVTVIIEPAPGETDTKNNQVTHWFSGADL